MSVKYSVSHGMPIGDDEAAKAFPRIIQDAETLLNGDRNSPPAKQNLAGIESTRKKNASQNETTFTTKFFKVFLNKSRKVNAQNGHHPQNSDLAVPIGSEDREWEQDGLFDVYNQDFLPSVIPKITPQDQNQAALLGDLPRVSTPKPNTLFGGLTSVYLSTPTVLTIRTGYDLANPSEREAITNRRYFESHKSARVLPMPSLESK